MTLVKWIVKEVLSARKLNNFGLRRLAAADKSSVADEDRLAGDLYHNTDTKCLERYHSGTGSTFVVSEVSNFMHHTDQEIGIGSTKQTVVDENFINRAGLCNTRVLVMVKYIQEPNLASEVEAIVTDGSNPDSELLSLGSTGSPTVQTYRFLLDTVLFALNADVNVKVKLKNAIMYDCEIRGI